MVKPKDFFGKNVTEAISEACSGLSVSQDKLNIDVLETGSVGIFGLCRKKAHIRVKLKKEVQEGQKRHVAAAEGNVTLAEVADAGQAMVAEAGRDKSREQAREDKSVFSDNETDGLMATKTAADGEVASDLPSLEALESIRADIDRLLHMMGYKAVVRVQLVDNTVQCDIESELQEEIIGQDGRTLDSLQYLVRKMTSRRLPERMPLCLDVGDFRRRRRTELRQQALDLAEKVKNIGKTQVIAALNPSERRIVHMVLQDDKKVRSRSVGEGLFKKVLIYKPGRGRKSNSRKRRGRQGGRSGNSQ